MQTVAGPCGQAMLYRRKGSCAQSSVLWVRWASKDLLPFSASSATRQENLFPCLLYQKMKEQKKTLTTPTYLSDLCSGVWATWIKQQCSAVQLTWDSFGRHRCESPCIYLFGMFRVKPANGTQCFGLTGETQLRVQTKENQSTVKVITTFLELVLESQVV